MGCLKEEEVAVAALAGTRSEHSCGWHYVVILYTFAVDQSKRNEMITSVFKQIFQHCLSYAGL